jgi:hypothetical protein
MENNPYLCSMKFNPPGRNTFYGKAFEPIRERVFDPSV